MLCCTWNFLEKSSCMWKEKGGLCPGFRDSGPGVKGYILTCASIVDKDSKNAVVSCQETNGTFPGESMADCLGAVSSFLDSVLI